MDLVQEFDLTIVQAVQISDHLPVWAEFSSRSRAARLGRIARPTSGAAR